MKRSAPEPISSTRELKKSLTHAIRGWRIENDVYPCQFGYTFTVIPTKRKPFGLSAGNTLAGLELVAVDYRADGSAEITALPANHDTLLDFVLALEDVFPNLSEARPYMKQHMIMELLAELYADREEKYGNLVDEVIEALEITQFMQETSRDIWNDVQKPSIN